MDAIHDRHRWTRWYDQDSGERRHWCIDGDTDHHEEPCQAAADRTGEHENDDPETTPEEWHVAMPIKDIDAPDAG